MVTEVPIRDNLKITVEHNRFIYFFTISIVSGKRVGPMPHRPLRIQWLRRQRLCFFYIWLSRFPWDVTLNSARCGNYKERAENEVTWQVLFKLARKRHTSLFFSIQWPKHGPKETGTKGKLISLNLLVKL